MFNKMVIPTTGGGKNQYYNFICPAISKSITLDFTPTRIYCVASHLTSDYNPVVQKWESGALYRCAPSEWNNRENTEPSWISTTGYGDFAVNGRTITITPLSDRNSYYIQAE